MVYFNENRKAIIKLVEFNKVILVNNVIFTAGDVVTRTKSVISAIDEGRKSAVSTYNYAPVSKDILKNSISQILEDIHSKES
ncbi:hypothetical protein B9W14_13275 [Clostridium drakei]|uniref:Uncharacterized protein n=2 Tax=Clostridium drakei TaxID=332101 RepID=A0A2U8DSI6_9CLOT|nr:hypothetical protein B9W14_13275 [Clostridium drakei]